MENDSFVRDKEELYRSVRGEMKYDEYSINDAGEYIIQPAAFRDRNKQPSVDRAKLRDFNPSLSKLGDTDGIVSLRTGEVRRLSQNDIELTDHTIDVIYMPTMENPAHSQIIMPPNSSISKTRERKAFKSLQKALTCKACKPKRLDFETNTRLIMIHIMSGNKDSDLIILKKSGSLTMFVPT